MTCPIQPRRDHGAGGEHALLVAHLLLDGHLAAAQRPPAPRCARPRPPSGPAASGTSRPCRRRGPAARSPPGPPARPRCRRRPRRDRPAARRGSRRRAGCRAPAPAAPRGCGCAPRWPARGCPPRGTRADARRRGWRPSRRGRWAGCSARAGTGRRRPRSRRAGRSPGQISPWTSAPPRHRAPCIPLGRHRVNRLTAVLRRGRLPHTLRPASGSSPAGRRGW